MQKQTLVYCLKALLDTFPNKKDTDETSTLMGEWSILFSDVPDETFVEATKILLKRNKFFPSVPEVRGALRKADLIAQGKILDEIHRQQRIKKEANRTDEDIRAYAWLFSKDKESYEELKREAEETREEARRELAGNNRIAEGNNNG